MHQALNKKAGAYIGFFLAVNLFRNDTVNFDVKK